MIFRDFLAPFLRNSDKDLFQDGSLDKAFAETRGEDFFSTRAAAQPIKHLHVCLRPVYIFSIHIAATSTEPPKSNQSY